MFCQHHINNIELQSHKERLYRNGKREKNNSSGGEGFPPFQSIVCFQMVDREWPLLDSRETQKIKKKNLMNYCKAYLQTIWVFSWNDTMKNLNIIQIL